MPEEAVYVGRPTKWGNPFVAGDVVHRGPLHSGRDEVVRDAAHACALFRRSLLNRRDAERLLRPLRGKDLACWCPLDQPCHADVLLELANPPATHTRTFCEPGRWACHGKAWPDRA